MLGYSPTYQESAPLAQISPPARDVKGFSPLAQEVKTLSSPAQVVKSPFEAKKASKSMPQASKPFDALMSQPQSPGHSRGLLSSLLLQEQLRVDGQQELQALAIDLGSIEENQSLAPASLEMKSPAISEVKSPASSEVKIPEDPKPQPPQVDSNGVDKTAQRQPKSVSYLLCQEDVQKARQSKSTKASSLREAVLASAESGSPVVPPLTIPKLLTTPKDPPLTTPKHAVTFRAAPEQRSKALSESPEVLLHIYEVGELSEGVQQMLSTVFGKNAFHVGVEIYGIEWAFGQSKAHHSASGISASSSPKTHPCHRYKETLSLGRTSKSPEEVSSLITSMDFMWLAKEYHPLRRNCVNFAEEMCDKLGVDQPPAYLGALCRGLKNFLLV